MTGIRQQSGRRELRGSRPPTPPDVLIVSDGEAHEALVLRPSVTSSHGDCVKARAGSFAVRICNSSHREDRVPPSLPTGQSGSS